MKKHSIRLLAVILAFAVAVPARGQGIGETLKTLLEDNARGYVGPISTAFGTAVNSGTFHRAKPHKILGFDFTLNIAVAIVPDAGQFYDFILPDQLTLPIDDSIIPELGNQVINVELIGADLYAGNNLRSATFFGPDSSFAITPDNSYVINQVKAALPAELPQSVIDDATTAIEAAVEKLTIQTPPGFKFPIMFMPIPQVSVGLPFSTEVTLGGFSFKVRDSEISFSRIGGKIGLNQFIPTIPLVFPAFSLGYYTTNLDLGGVLKANNSIMTLQVSKSVPFITVYGGLGFESSSIEVDYTFEDDELGTVPISFSLDGDNSFRTTVGFRLKLLLLSLHGDYSTGEYTAYNFGIGLTFR